MMAHCGIKKKEILFHLFFLLLKDRRAKSDALISLFPGVLSSDPTDSHQGITRTKKEKDSVK